MCVENVTGWKNAILKPICVSVKDVGECWVGAGFVLRSLWDVEDPIKGEYNVCGFTAPLRPL